MYLLDTNVCIDFLLDRSEPLALRIGEQFERLVVSAITVAELMVGNRASVDPKGDLRKVEMFVASVEVSPFGQSAAAIYGDIVRRIGVRRTNFDRLIAAQALALNQTLVTNNERDFRDVPGLRVENWAAV